MRLSADTGLAEIEQELAERLGLKRVFVVPGDSDDDETVKKEIARVTAEFLRAELVPGDVLAVTGGTTLAEVAKSLPASNGGNRRDRRPCPGRVGRGGGAPSQHGGRRDRQAAGGRLSPFRMSRTIWGRRR